MKTYIRVIAQHQLDGSLCPLKIEYEGIWYKVDRVSDVRMAASLKLGGQGMRYTCKIAGRQVYLFCDNGQWFLEQI